MLTQNENTSNSGTLLKAVAEMDSLTLEKKSSESWEEPKPFQTEAKTHIELDCLPQVFADMCRAISESLCVSTDMAAACGLGVLSVCCNKHNVCLKDGWFQPLSLYMVGCAPAGEKKSPVLNVLRRPVDNWVRQKNIELKPQVAESKQQYKNLQAMKNKAERNLEKGTGDEAETIRLAQAIDEFEAIRPIRLYSADVTSEKLTMLLQENNEIFSILSSEGGILQVLSGDRYGNGTANYDVYCQAYNGEAVTYDRIGSGTVVLEHPVLSMVLFIQPVILAGLLGNDTLKGVGLVDRCLFYAPESTIGRERFDTPPIDPRIETNYSNMILRLLNEPQKRTLRLSDGARKDYAEWFNQITSDIPVLYNDQKGWISKFRGTVGRIAGILQMCEDDSDIISEETMVNAIVISDYFAEQARMILNEGKSALVEQYAEHILNYIRTHRDKTSVNDDGQIVMKRNRLMQDTKKKGLYNINDYREPLQELIDRNYIDLSSDDYMKASEIYVNPKIWK